MRYHWTVTQKLIAHDASSYDNFGWSVSFHNNITVIGAYGDSTQDQPYAGSIYVFQRKYTNSLVSLWTQTQKLLSYEYRGNSFFGWSVCVWDDVIVVGTKSNGNSGNDRDKTVSSGAVYLYRYSTDDEEWIFEKKLAPPSGRVVNNYGTSIDIYKDSVIVGAYDEINGGDISSPSSSTPLGSTFVYQSTYDDKDNSRDWILLNEITSNSTVEKNLKFGSSVKIYDDIILVGATLGDGVMTDTGTVYVFIKSIDTHALGHPVSERTYFALVLFLPLLFIGMCFVITLARIFMKPTDHTTSEDEIDDGSQHSTFSYYYDSEMNSNSVRVSDLLFGRYSHHHHQQQQQKQQYGSDNDDQQSTHSSNSLIRFHTPRK